MRAATGQRWLVVFAVVLLALSTSPAAWAGGEGPGGDAETDFTPITDKHGISASVGLLGTTNSEGYRLIGTVSNCHFSTYFLTSRGPRYGDGITIQDLLRSQFIIVEEVDPVTGESTYVPGDGWQDRFSDLPSSVGGANNCIQPGVQYLRAGCLAVLPGTLTNFDHPVEGVTGVWVAGGLNVFMMGLDGVSGDALWVCAEAYDEATFTAAVMDQTNLVEPVVTLEAQVRAAVGAEIGAWYSVADHDLARNPFTEEFRMHVPTLGDAIPADVVVWLEEIRWDFDGDGNWDVVDRCVPPDAPGPPDEFDCGGSTTNPVGAFTYEYRGLYNPSVQLQWDGYYVAYFQLFTSRGEFDTDVMTTEGFLIDYPVIEIRSSLDG